jgi:hypothetical protein
VAFQTLSAWKILSAGIGWKILSTSIGRKIASTGIGWKIVSPGIGAQRYTCNNESWCEELRHDVCPR